MTAQPSPHKDAVRKVLDAVKANKRTSLTAPEGKLVCDAYGIPVPGEGVASSAADAAKLASAEKHIGAGSSAAVRQGEAGAGTAGKAADRPPVPGRKRRMMATTAASLPR